MINNKTFAFRHPKDLAEMEALIRLRYGVYKDIHPNFIPDNDYGLDLDNYDPMAYHFGVFDEESNLPVGYLRVITDTPIPAGGGAYQSTCSWV